MVGLLPGGSGVQRRLVQGGGRGVSGSPGLARRVGGRGLGASEPGGRLSWRCGAGGVRGPSAGFRERVFERN